MEKVIFTTYHGHYDIDEDLDGLVIRKLLSLLRFAGQDVESCQQLVGKVVVVAGYCSFELLPLLDDLIRAEGISFKSSCL